MIVCIAEKPSVAKDIARIIGATTARDGYNETGSHNQFYYAETRSSCTSASTFNNSWGGTYSTLKDALISVKVAEEEQNFITKGIAELFVAYNLAILTDM